MEGTSLPSWRTHEWWGADPGPSIFIPQVQAFILNPLMLNKRLQLSGEVLVKEGTGYSSATRTTVELGLTGVKLNVKMSIFSV